MSAGLPLIAWGLEALAASTLLMTMVLIVRGPVRRAFGAEVAYALWALPLLRLILPPLPASWHAVAATPITRAGETITVLVVGAGQERATAPVEILSLAWPSIGVLVAALWAIGAAAFLGWHLAYHARFCATILDRGEETERRGRVRVVASDAAVGPLAFGIVRRYVAFPRDFAERYDADECALALAHEIGHHQRGDLIANWIALVVLALHWFNPVAWRAFRAYRADHELANDARVLAGRSATDRHIYACAIVKAAHGGAVSAACHLHTISDLKGRLRMLTTSRTSRARLATGVAAVAALVTGGLALTISGTSAASALTARVGDAVGVDLQVPPAPPAPPAPAVPGAPAAPEAPPAPPAPVHAGKTTRTRIVQTRVGDDTVNLAGMPEVIERNCIDGKDGDSKRFVIQSKKGAANLIVICTNRIEQAASEGARVAANSAEIERQAMATARTSLATARLSIARERNLTEEQRKAALAGIDEAAAELDAKQKD